MKRSIARLACLALLSFPATAQLCPDTHVGTLHIVDYATMGANFQCVVDHAANGDTILLGNGSYGGFVVDGKSLTIAPLWGDSPTIDGEITIQNLAFGQTFHMRGIDCTLPHQFPQATYQLLDNVGQVYFEDIAFAANDLTEASVTMVIEDSDAVVFSHCDLSGRDASEAAPTDFPMSACEITSSTVAFQESSVAGGAGRPSTIFLAGGDGAPAIITHSGDLFFGNSAVTGGAGATGWTTGFCTNGGNGGDGLQLLGAGALANSCSSTFLGGAAGLAAGSCSSGVGGLPVLEVVAGLYYDIPNCYPVGITSSWIPNSGGVDITVDVLGQPGQTVFVAYDFAPAYSYQPAFRGVIHLSPRFTAGVVSLDGSGAGSLFIPVPSSVSYSGLNVYFQGMHLSGGGSDQLGSVTAVSLH